MKTNLKNLIIFTSLLFSLVSTQVFAAGETMCSASTAKSNVEIYLLNSRMVGSPVLSGGAQVTTVINNQSVTFGYGVDEGHLHGYWSYGNELKILFYSELDASEVLETDVLTVEMKYDSNTNEMVGEFTILKDQIEIDRGPITCEFG